MHRDLSLAAHCPADMSKAEYQVALPAGCVEAWQKPSEMFDELAQFIAMVVGWTHEGAGLVKAARRYARTESRGVDLLNHGAWCGFIQRFVKVDRFRAWKLALHGWLAAECELLRFCPNAAAQRACDELIANVDRQWVIFDDMPPAIAARFSFALGGGIAPHHTVGIIQERHPALLYKIAAAEHRLGDVIPQWLLDIAERDPMQALKLGVEAYLRACVEGDGTPDVSEYEARLN